MNPAIRQRNSAMEILRILAMFLIIFSHYTGHGIGAIYDSSFNGIVTALFKTGNIGTDIFVLLSGYFLINSKFSFKKVFTLISQVLFYSVGIYLICCLTSIQSFSFRDALMSFFPTSFSLYWFFTTYIVMYILSPFVNKFLNSLSKGQHLKVMFTVSFLWIIIPTFTTRAFAGNELTFFLTLYIIGAYLKKYPENILSKGKNDIIVVISSSILLALSVIGIIFAFPSLTEYATYFYSKQSLFVVLLSAGLLSFFSKIKPFYSKPLNTVAGATFGIYLIHDNQFFRSFMWKEILNTDKYGSGNFMIINMLVCSVIVFAVCFIIELLRKKLIEKPILALYDKIYNKISPHLLHLSQKLFK